jgi:nucleoside-diphosphate-sugar epimerase
MKETPKQLRNILITGGAGYYGKALVDYLLTLNQYKVYVVDNISNADSLERAEAIKYTASVSYVDTTYIQYVWRDKTFDYIIHLAGNNDIYSLRVDLPRALIDNVLSVTHAIERCLSDDTTLIVPKFIPTETDDIGDSIISFYQGLKFAVIDMAVNEHKLSTVKCVVRYDITPDEFALKITELIQKQ